MRGSCSCRAVGAAGAAEVDAMGGGGARKGAGAEDGAAGGGRETGRRCSSDARGRLRLIGSPSWEGRGCADEGCCWR